MSKQSVLFAVTVVFLSIVGGIQQAGATGFAMGPTLSLGSEYSKELAQRVRVAIRAHTTISGTYTTPRDYLKALQVADPEAGLRSVSDVPSYLEMLRYTTAAPSSYVTSWIWKEGQGPSVLQIRPRVQVRREGEGVFWNPNTGKVVLDGWCGNIIQGVEKPRAKPPVRNNTPTPTLVPTPVPTIATPSPICPEGTRGAYPNCEVLQRVKIECYIQFDVASDIRLEIVYIELYNDPRPGAQAEYRLPRTVHVGKNEIQAPCDIIKYQRIHLCWGPGPYGAPVDVEVARQEHGKVIDGSVIFNRGHEILFSRKTFNAAQKAARGMPSGQGSEIGRIVEGVGVNVLNQAINQGIFGGGFNRFPPPQYRH